MGTLKRMTGTVCIGLAFQLVMMTATMAQDYTRDTELLYEYFTKAGRFQNEKSYDSAVVYYYQAAAIYGRYEHWTGVVQCATQIAVCFQEQGNYGKAAALLKAVVESSLDYTGENDTIIAEAYFVLGNQYYNQSNFDSTLIYWIKSLNISKELHGEKHYYVAASYYNIGTVYHLMTAYDKALEYHYRGLQLKTELLGEKHPDVANSYTNIGNVYFDLSEYSKALECYNNSLRIRKESYGEKHPDVANSYNNIGNTLYRLSEYDKALEYHLNSLQIRIELFGERHPDVALSYNNIGLVYNELSTYNKALEYHTKSLEIRTVFFGMEHPDVAMSYNNIGITCNMLNEYDKALEYLLKGLQIRTKLFGESHPDVSESCVNIGSLYFLKADYGKALEYYTRSLQINLELFGERHADVADSYISIGNVYYENVEYDKALEYFYKGLQIRTELHGEEHVVVAKLYNNIGNVYFEKSGYDRSLEYHNKSLLIRTGLFGEIHTEVAQSYDNIGNVLSQQSDYDKALEYYQKGLQIRLELLGEKHSDVAASYNNMGIAYKEKSAFDKALEYYYKSLYINLELLGEKHDLVASSYINIGNAYEEKTQYLKALENYHLGMTANLWDQSISKNITGIPGIRNYISFKLILNCLQSKAQIFADTLKRLAGMENLTAKHRLELALLHYRACDTLIVEARQEITGKSDKLALGKKASEIYTEAVEVCNRLSALCGPDSVSYFEQQAFKFSEKNKASVLLESLAGAEAMKFAGIPDNLLKMENELSSNIALYKKLLAEQPDSARETRFRNLLFMANRSYDSLISEFEHRYPKYHELKYGLDQVTVGQLQETLDDSTCFISYQESDSSITAFLVTQGDLKVSQREKMADYESMINSFRSKISVYRTSSTDEYLDIGYTLYKQLFFHEIPGEITRIIIIPDGEMALIPFEALITEYYRGYNFSDFPYLIKQYGISYSYSAELYYRTLPKQSTDETELVPLDDWLALAPVFDDEETAGTTLRTREILKEMDEFTGDSTSTRGSFLAGDFITPIPGTRDEAETIFRQFDEQNRKATVLLYKNASESFMKSGDLKKYKYIHIASHGIVNTLKPELSGIILARDTASGEDGILHTGEMYNIELDAELTVLSACETGVGEIKEGEGLIGLTRALLYAGSRNIIVSLWKVADISTSQLMVDYYSNLLKKENEVHRFSDAMREAKLNMISEERFAHPFFWSPFILVGI
jgi:CHAT domain-containing protein/tetratricopeptide (TPR) repeat protein